MLQFTGFSVLHVKCVNVCGVFWILKLYVVEIIPDGVETEHTIFAFTFIVNKYVGLISQFTPVYINIRRQGIGDPINAGMVDEILSPIAVY
jgi:hypothetical protein